MVVRPVAARYLHDGFRVSGSKWLILEPVTYLGRDRSRRLPPSDPEELPEHFSTSTQLGLGGGLRVWHVPRE